MKKFNVCKALVGLMLLTSSCSSKAPSFQLTGTLQLPYFPSSSALHFYKGRLYVFGDDAPYVLILDSNFKTSDSVRYLADTARRIEKRKKPDIESVSLLKNDQVPSLLAFGSMSTSARNRSFVFPLFNPHQYKVLPLNDLQTALKGVAGLNIEGATFIANRLVLVNRAHLGRPTNQLLVLNTFAAIPKLERVIPVSFPTTNGVIGISDLYYNAVKDQLLFVASQEATSSTYEDGAIGNSFIGWINRFSGQLDLQRIKVNGLVNLSDVDRNFEHQKIEGLCIMRAEKTQTTLVLSADNDDGKSTLFTVTMRD